MWRKSQRTEYMNDTELDDIGIAILSKLKQGNIKANK